MMLRIVSLCLLTLLAAACAPAPPANNGPQPDNDATLVAALPQGDPERGAALFGQQISGAQACTTCHSLDGSAGIGPTVQGYGAVAATRVGGESAEEYTYHAIVQPIRYIVPGYPNVMYALYDAVLSEQQIADLIAYLLTL